jgi:SAM-dependent methyltransferase
MSGERVCPQNIKTREEFFIYLKGIFLYEWSKSRAGNDAVCLDIGCGEGYGASAFAMGVKHLTAIDVDKKTIAAAVEKYRVKNLNFMIYDGSRLPFADNSFDIVTAFHVLEHVENDICFIDEAKRVLKPGGQLILATPNKEMRLPGAIAPWNIHHLREYNDVNLKVILACHFIHTDIFGVGACPEVITIEKARIRQAVKIAAWDRFQLRRKLPRWFVGRMVKMVHAAKGLLRRPLPYKSEELDNEIYFMGVYSKENSLDVVAVCIK